MPEGIDCCDCIKESTSSNNHSNKNGILYMILGCLGALFSFPTFISEIQHNTRWHGGIITAIGMLWDDYSWVIPTVIISIILFIVGLNKLTNGKKEN